MQIDGNRRPLALVVGHANTHFQAHHGLPRLRILGRLRAPRLADRPQACRPGRRSSRHHRIMPDGVSRRRRPAPIAVFSPAAPRHGAPPPRLVAFCFPPHKASTSTRPREQDPGSCCGYHRSSVYRGCRRSRTLAFPGNRLHVEGRNICTSTRLLACIWRRLVPVRQRPSIISTPGPSPALR